MNLKRLEILIGIMERVQKKNGHLNLSTWQAVKNCSFNIAHTERELHRCGTAACVAGWLAVSPEFKEVGGRPGYIGMPLLHEKSGAEAVAEYLGCTEQLAQKITAIGKDACQITWYGPQLRNVKMHHVIKKLKKLYKKEEGLPCY